MTQDHEHRIRERPQAIWEREERPHGRHADHWQHASQEIGDELFGDEGTTTSQNRPGALDGGLLPSGGLVAAGGPGGAAIGGLGMAGEPAEDEDTERDR